jgi:hypothetical protein
MALPQNGEGNNMRDVKKEVKLPVDGSVNPRELYVVPWQAVEKQEKGEPKAIGPFFRQNQDSKPELAAEPKKQGKEQKDDTPSTASHFF